MNTEDESHLTPVQRMLESQRPPPANEPLPALPDDLRRRWSAHFGAPVRATRTNRWAWVAGLAAAAAIVVAFVIFTEISPDSHPSSASQTTAALLVLPTGPLATDEARPLSPVTLALLHYQDPSTTGLYVRQ